MPSGRVSIEPGKFVAFIPRQLAASWWFARSDSGSVDSLILVHSDALRRVFTCLVIPCHLRFYWSLYVLIYVRWKTDAKPSRVPSQSDWLLRASIMILLCASQGRLRSGASQQKSPEYPSCGNDLDKSSISKDIRAVTVTSLPMVSMQKFVIRNTSEFFRRQR